MENVQTEFVADSETGQQYCVVVAVSKPTHVEQLMRTASDLAADTGGVIHVVTVIHKSASSPFLLFSDDQIKTEFADGRGEILSDAVAAVEDTGVPVEDHLLVSSDVSNALRTVVDDFEANAVLIGWQHRSQPSDIVLGTTVDPLVRRAPCDVFVERVGTTTERVDSILLPTDGGPHIDPATGLAGAIARANDATVSVVSYVAPRAGDDDHETAQAHVRQAREQLSDVSVRTDVREAGAVGESIVSDAADNDLVVLGATRERRFRRRVVGSVAEAVGQSATVPIIIAKRQSEGSFLKRALGRL